MDKPKKLLGIFIDTPFGGELSIWIWKEVGGSGVGRGGGSSMMVL